MIRLEQYGVLVGVLVREKLGGGNYDLVKGSNSGGGKI